MPSSALPSPIGANGTTLALVAGMTTATPNLDPQALIAEIIDEFTGVVGFAELLQGDPAQRSDYAEEVIQAAERALELVRLLSDKLHRPWVDRSCRVDEVLLGLEPSLRRVLGPNIPLDVCLRSGLEPIPLHRRDLEGLLLYLVAAARDAYTTPGRIRVRSTRGTRLDGRRVARIVVEDDAGPPRIGDLRWFLLENHPADLLNPVTPFYERALDAGGSITVESAPGEARTAVCVEFPLEADDSDPDARFGQTKLHGVVETG